MLPRSRLSPLWTSLALRPTTPLVPIVAFAPFSQYFKSNPLVRWGGNLEVIQRGYNIHGDKIGARRMRMEEMIGAVAQFIGQVGFPIFVAVYVLMRLEPTINKLNDTVKVLTIITAKQSGIDYNEVVKEYEVAEGKKR